MFFWNSLTFFMTQWMLAIWSLVLLPFLNPAWTSETSQLTHYWRLAWRILRITLLACEMSAIVWSFEYSLAFPFFGIGKKDQLHSNPKEDTKPLSKPKLSMTKMLELSDIVLKITMINMYRTLNKKKNWQHESTDGWSKQRRKQIIRRNPGN